MESFASLPAVYAVEKPCAARVPLVVASPHSGSVYPPDLLDASGLDLPSLRRSEDCFVDELFAAAPAHGIPLLKALFARAYVDPNREPWELDRRMFEDPLPGWVNTESPRVAGGLGTIARIVADGRPIYRRKLRFEEARARVELLYEPYHRALEALVADTVGQFGQCILIDAHSMPSSDGQALRHGARRRADIVLGDRHGRSCDASITETAERFFQDLGYEVARNMPYAGGYTTTHYGRPAAGRHCLQIEINRMLYMDEQRLIRTPQMAQVTMDITGLLGLLSELGTGGLRAA